jgi:hypothetical protein
MKDKHLQHDIDPVETRDQYALHLSPFSMKGFKNHLSKAFGLGYISEESVLLPAQEDESSTTPCERVSPEPIVQSCREQNFENNDTPSQLKPDCSNASYIQETNSGTLKRLPSFIEIKSWSKEEVICQYYEEDVEFNYLDEDSPLKGKGKATWRKPEPALNLWKARSEIPSIPSQISPLKRSKIQQEPGSERMNYQKRKSEAIGGDFEVRFHRKRDEGDNRQDLILKFPSKPILRRYDR